MQIEPEVIKASTPESPLVRRPGGSTSSSHLGRFPEKMQPLLFLMALLLSPKAEAGEIIGGHEAEPHSRPYMAYVKITSSKNKYCGGFLVREDFVLTAAHCLGSSITVVLGAHNIKVNESTQQVIPVRTPIPHPKFNETTAENDIMLLKLEDKAKLNDAVRIIDLPGRRDKVKPGMVCSVAGWGRLGVNITRTGKLNEAELEIQTDKECTSHFEYYNKKFQICVGDPTKIQASFHGDSGGPFVCGQKAQAIISFGDENGKPPVVYTRIKYLLPWIKKTMKRFKLWSSD
ncbi:mast cell protease 1A isoform X1 [Rhinolophus sinicus]|uniref:mast cell protease 1A isoform X1 n=1 Tax=Rhinolophus sinicus TaxID=89399 RepID=UPI003D78CC8E